LRLILGGVSALLGVSERELEEVIESNLEKFLKAGCG
jgi:hypothetical protein